MADMTHTLKPTHTATLSDPTPRPGTEIAGEGRALFAELYGAMQRGDRTAIADRLLRRSRRLLRSPATDDRAIAFFLFGLSEGARGDRRHG